MKLTSWFAFVWSIYLFYLQLNSLMPPYEIGLCYQIELWIIVRSPLWCGRWSRPLLKCLLNITPHVSTISKHFQRLFYFFELTTCWLTAASYFLSSRLWVALDKTSKPCLAVLASRLALFTQTGCSYLCSGAQIPSPLRGEPQTRSFFRLFSWVRSKISTRCNTHGH